MKKNRIHIYITLSIFVIAFIIGSFVDQALSAGLFSRNNTFGLICSTIGTIPGYGVFSITGGMLLSLILYRSYSKIWKVMFGLASVVLVGVSIFFIGREFFSSNGFENEKLYYLGFVITLPIVAGLYYLGFRMGKSSDNPQL